MPQVLCLSCSPRRGGNTDFCTRVLAEELRALPGVNVEVVRLEDYNIKHCMGCRGCMKLKDCVIRDDDFHEIWRHIAAADVIVQLSPVYWLGPPGKHKDLIDRSHAWFACGKVLAGKTGCSISIAAEAGFESHEAVVESWLGWYGASIKARLRILARQTGDAAASSATKGELRRIAMEIVS
jgi:multimeric flavodoxin WrbA